MGRVGRCPEPLAVLGAQCTLLGLNKTDDELFWTVRQIRFRNLSSKLLYLVLLKSHLVRLNSYFLLTVLKGLDFTNRLAISCVIGIFLDMLLKTKSLCKGKRKPHSLKNIPTFCNFCLNVNLLLCCRGFKNVNIRLLLKEF